MMLIFAIQFTVVVVVVLWRKEVVYPIDGQFGRHLISGYGLRAVLGGRKKGLVAE